MFSLELDVVAGFEVLAVEAAVLLEEAAELESDGAVVADIVGSEDWAGLGPMRLAGVGVSDGVWRGGSKKKRRKRRRRRRRRGGLGMVEEGEVKRRGCDQSRETAGGHASQTLPTTPKPAPARQTTHQPSCSSGTVKPLGHGTYDKHSRPITRCRVGRPDVCFCCTQS